MSIIENTSSRGITPEQELQVLKLILSLRLLGDVAASERLRGRVRRVLLESADDETAITEVEELIRRALKAQSKLDGSYEKARELKRQRREANMAKTSRFIDIEAGSGEEDEEPGSGESETEENV